MTKLSVVISTYNSQDKIEDCLKSVKFADEIIVINNTSLDRTQEIAQKYTSKIFIRPNNLMLNVNKNFGFSKATGDWILCLDDDERVTPGLEEEIKKLLKNDNSETSGYWIPRKNIIFGKWIQHAGWYPDPQLRLFKRGKGMFAEKHVHEMVKVNGEIATLMEPMLHYNYQTVSQFLYKMNNIYVPNEAEVLMTEGYNVNYSDAIKFPLKEFLSRYFALEGYKDGFHGLMLSMLMAFYHFCIFALIWQEQGFKQLEGNTLEISSKEMKHAAKDIGFWITESKIKSTKNPINKVLLRARRRLLK